MDLLQQLAELDRKKASLERYIPRMRMALWLAPGLSRRLVRELNGRIDRLGDKRNEVLREIRADPHANRRLHELYEVKSEPSARMPQAIRGFTPSEELKLLGHRVVDWEATEAQANLQFLDALGYYSQGFWQKEHISSETMDAFINGLRSERDDARLSRGAALDAFQRALERQLPVGLGPVSLQREEMLAEYRKTALAPSPVDVVARFRESQQRLRVRAPSAMAERER